MRETQREESSFESLYYRYVFITITSLTPVVGSVPSKLCTCARTHTGQKMGAHKKTLPKMFLHIISYTSFHIQIKSGKMLHTRNCMCTQTLKDRGNIGCWSLQKTIIHCRSQVEIQPMREVEIQPMREAMLRLICKLSEMSFKFRPK